MPRPILNQKSGSLLSTDSLSISRQEKKQSAQQMDKLVLDRLLRKPRSKAYMEAMHRLDAGGHVCNQAKVDEIINVLREEFPEVEIAGVLLGVVSVCYLGHPYEVHTLDITGSIIEHYQAGHPMPGPLENARTLAMRGGYEFIEVYADCCRCVSSSGAVSVVNF